RDRSVSRRVSCQASTRTRYRAPSRRLQFEQGERGSFFFFKQKTAYEIGLGIPAEPLFRSNLRKTLLMASSVRLKPLNCSRLPCVYAQETLTFLLTQKKTCVKNYVQKE